MVIDPATRRAIGAAVKAAETTTDAEIVVVSAAQSDSYRDAVLQWAVLGMFALLSVQAVVPGHFVPVLDWMTGGWPRTWSLTELLVALLVLLAFVFVVLRFALMRFAVSLALPSTRARRVRRRAVMLFRASIEARTATRTGVLLYLSLAERRAEIVVDAAIHAKAPDTVWGDAMAELVVALREGRAGDGVLAAIERIRIVLAAHFPHTGTDPNELPDGLIEL